MRVADDNAELGVAKKKKKTSQRMSTSPRGEPAELSNASRATVLSSSCDFRFSKTIKSHLLDISGEGEKRVCLYSFKRARACRNAAFSSPRGARYSCFKKKGEM